MTDPIRTPERWFVERPSPNKAGHTQVCGPLSKEDAQKQMDAWRAERMDLTPYMWDIPEKETEPPAADPTRTLADLAQAVRDVLDNEQCSCYQNGGPCARCKLAYDNLEALAALVPPREQETENVTRGMLADGRDAQYWFDVYHAQCAQLAAAELRERVLQDSINGCAQRVVKLHAQLAALRAQIDSLVLEMSLWCIDNKGHYHEDDIEEIVKKWADTLAALSRPHPPEEQP